MALKYKIEWDPEEVAVGYDFSSIYEGLDENTTVPVIFSVVNTTDLVGHSASNITAVVKEVMDHVVNSTINPTTMTYTTVAPLSSSTPSTVSTIVKRVVEQLAKEPLIPVATVCIYFFKHSIEYSTVLYIIEPYFIHFTIQYITLYNLFHRPAASRLLWC